MTCKHANWTKSTPESSVFVNRNLRLALLCPIFAQGHNTSWQGISPMICRTLKHEDQPANTSYQWQYRKYKVLRPPLIMQLVFQYRLQSLTGLQHWAANASYHRHIVRSAASGACKNAETGQGIDCNNTLLCKEFNISFHPTAEHPPCFCAN